jgi:ribosomal protein L24E
MNNTEGEHTRVCKNCGATFKEPLKEEGKLWLFCSSKCRQAWDEGRMLGKEDKEGGKW